MTHPPAEPQPDPRRDTPDDPRAGSVRLTGEIEELAHGGAVLDRRLTGDLDPQETVTGIEFDGCTFEGCQLAEGRFLRCTFIGCRFIGCDLSMVQLTDSRLVGGSFERCKMLAIDAASLGVSPLAIEPIRFEDCLLDFASFQGVELSRSMWHRCALRDADFAEAVLTGADFAGSELSGARFARTDLREVSLVDARGYVFDVRENRVQGLRIDAHEGGRLLEVLGLRVE